MQLISLTGNALREKYFCPWFYIACDAAGSLTKSGSLVCLRRKLRDEMAQVFDVSDKLFLLFGLLVCLLTCLKCFIINLQAKSTQNCFSWNVSMRKPDLTY